MGQTQAVARPNTTRLFVVPYNRHMGGKLLRDLTLGTLSNGEPFIEWTVSNEREGEVPYNIVMVCLEILDNFYNSIICNYKTLYQQSSTVSDNCPLRLTKIEGVVLDTTINEVCQKNVAKFKVDSSSIDEGGWVLFYDRNEHLNRREVVNDFLSDSFIIKNDEDGKWGEEQERLWAIRNPALASASPKVKSIFQYHEEDYGGIDKAEAFRQYNLALDFLSLANFLGIAEVEVQGDEDDDDKAGKRLKIIIPWSRFTSKNPLIPIKMEGAVMRSNFLRFWNDKRKELTAYFKQLQELSPAHFHVVVDEKNGDEMEALFVYVF